MRRQGFSPESAPAASTTGPTAPDAAPGRFSRYCGPMGIETAAASLAATFVGHSTVLLEVDGARILTDPLLRLRVGVLIRHSPVPPAAVYRDLDAVVISHAHLDHLDVPSLRLIDKDTPVLAPRATKRLIKRLGFADVTEMEAGESRDRRPRAASPRRPPCTAPRAIPWPQQGNTLGYLVQGRLTAYFAGDTGLFDEMAGLAEHLDLALLPVGGWGPRLPEDHLNPLTAAKALRLLRPAVAVPIHWGTLYPPWLPPAFNAKFGRWPVVVRAVRRSPDAGGRRARPRARRDHAHRRRRARGRYAAQKSMLDE